eukprot:scaffold1222_cov330-Prasinococcus_capsulatus_cf.AAC.6
MPSLQRLLLRRMWDNVHPHLDSCPLMASPARRVVRVPAGEGVSENSRVFTPAQNTPNDNL